MGGHHKEAEHTTVASPHGHIIKLPLNICVCTHRLADDSQLRAERHGLLLTATLPGPGNITDRGARNNE